MLIVTLINMLVVILVVIIHYECLLRLNDWLPQLKLWSRFRIVAGVFGALLAHALEVWCFALAYYLMAHADGWGTLSGNFDGSFWIACTFPSPPTPPSASATSPLPGTSNTSLACRH